MRESALMLGYPGSGLEQARPNSSQQMSQTVLRRTRYGARAGSGRVTLKRSFPLEGQLDLCTADEAETSAPAEKPSVSFKLPHKNVYQSKRRSRILDRKSGTGRSTTLRLFTLEAQDMTVASPAAEHAAPATNHVNMSMDIVPYDQPMEVDVCSSPEAGYVEEPCFEPMGSPMMDGPEEDVEDVEGTVQESLHAEAEVKVKMRRPRGEPHQRLRNYYKNRKSLAAHGLKINEEDGLRRSTRRRVQPLQYWRNEKVEYERQHRSLPTIAAIALRSPDECWPAPNPRNKRKTKSRIKELESQVDDE